jgi:hypothetical protein
LCIDSILTEILIADDGKLFKNCKLRSVGGFHEVEGLEEKRERLWIVLFETDLDGLAAASGVGDQRSLIIVRKEELARSMTAEDTRSRFGPHSKMTSTSGSRSTDSNFRGGDGVSFWGSVDGEVLLLRKGRFNIDPAACQS